MVLLLAACQPKPSSTPTATISSAIPSSIPSPTSTYLPKPTQTALATPVPVSASESAPLTAISLDQVMATLIDGVDWYLLIEDQEGKTILNQNADASFHPASMIKVPTAMVVLKIMENEGKSLADIQSYGVSGRNFAALLEAMIVQSEEGATDALEFFARGDNRLRKILDGWEISQTTYDPRRSSAGNLIQVLRMLDSGDVLTEEYRRFLLDLMGKESENDGTLLGYLLEAIPDCQFFNKRGTLLNPTIAADMGILQCEQQRWYLVVAGTPAAGYQTTFEDIQASIESFALAFGEYLRPQIAIAD